MASQDRTGKRAKTAMDRPPRSRYDAAMWLLFHRSSGARCVPGGETLVEHCPTCDRVTKLDEVEVKESVGLFFVDVIGNKERAFRCRVCGDVFDRRDREVAKPVATLSPKQLAAEQRARE